MIRKICIQHKDNCLRFDTQETETKKTKINSTSLLTLFSYMIIIVAHRKPKLQLLMILHVVIETYINKIINIMGNSAALQLCTISFLPVTTLFVFADNSQINFFKMRISRFEFKKFAAWKKCVYKEDIHVCKTSLR